MSFGSSDSHKTSVVNVLTMRGSVAGLTTGFLVILLFQIGCSAKNSEFVVPHDHPAHAEAPQAVFTPPMGMSTKDMASHGDEVTEHHVGPSLSEVNEKAFADMLDAYFAVGDQLASDTMEHVNAKTNEMLEAFHTLEHDAPAELWNSHTNHTLAIHDRGHELASTADINTARVIYGSLSEAVNHLIAPTGAPTSDERPVYKYICGMASDVPLGGVWLQKGTPARNPYFGSSMLRCYSEQTQVSAAATKEPSHEATQHDYHMRKPGDHDQHQRHMEPTELNPVSEHMKERD